MEIRQGQGKGLGSFSNGDRIDLIAYSYLGGAALWWIVCDYNGIFYPLDLEVGSVLRIPSLDHLNMRLLGS